MALAARGTRDLGDGEQTIEDPSEQAALRRQARQVTLRSGLLAVLGTLAILVLPL